MNDQTTTSEPFRAPGGGLVRFDAEAPVEGLPGSEEARRARLMALIDARAPELYGPMSAPCLDRQRRKRAETEEDAEAEAAWANAPHAWGSAVVVLLLDAEAAAAAADTFAMGADPVQTARMERERDRLLDLARQALAAGVPVRTNSDAALVAASDWVRHPAVWSVDLMGPLWWTARVGAREDGWESRWKGALAWTTPLPPAEADRLVALLPDDETRVEALEMALRAMLRETGWRWGGAHKSAAVRGQHRHWIGLADALARAVPEGWTPPPSAADAVLMEVLDEGDYGPLSASLGGGDDWDAHAPLTWVVAHLAEADAAWLLVRLVAGADGAALEERAPRRRGKSARRVRALDPEGPVLRAVWTALGERSWTHQARMRPEEGEDTGARLVGVLRRMTVPTAPPEAERTVRAVLDREDLQGVLGAAPAGEAVGLRHRGGMAPPATSGPGRRRM